MDTLRIGIGGSAANPPHLGHRALIEALLDCGKFDVIYWYLSGDRIDKDLIDADHRVAMTMLTMGPKLLLHPQTKLIIRFSDVYHKNTPTIALLREHQHRNPDAAISWYTGVDSVIPLEKYGGKCQLEVEWDEGPTLMRDWVFWIIPRKEYPYPTSLQLPQQFRILHVELPNITSTQIRANIASGLPFEHLVTEDVAIYIKRHRLFGYDPERYRRKR